MACSDENHGRSRRPGTEDRDGHTGRILSGRAIERSVVLCVICTVHMEKRSAGFLVEPQNQGRRFVSGLASKPLRLVSRFGLQNRQFQFGDFGLKITATVS
jgi:hypothetical protein